MTWPADAPATNEAITWREARYLARVVQMLVTSPNDREEFRRELEHLLRAAEALRAASAKGPRRAGPAPVRDATVCDLAEREPETAAEGAVVELWRSNSSVDYETLQAAGAVTPLRRSAPGPDPIDESELASAVDEIERAAAFLRAEEWRAEERRAAPVRVEAPQPMPPMKQQMVEFWLPVAAATVGMLAAIVSFIR
jgi:hypothetical protein